MANGRQKLGRYLAKTLTTDEQKALEARRAALAAQLSNLCTNKDFEDWLYWILEDLCAFGQGLDEWDAFAQGKRAAAEWIVQSLHRGGEDCAAMMARIYSRHYGNLVKKTNQEE